MSGPFDRFSDILNLLRRRYPTLGKRMEEAGALKRWEQAVGPHIARHARAICVKDSVLWVEVDHPIWRSELHHRKQQILKILNTPESPDPAVGGAQSPDSRESDEKIIEDILLLDPRQTAGASTYFKVSTGASAPSRKPK